MDPLTIVQARELWRGPIPHFKLDRALAENLAIVRRIAFTLLKKDRNTLSLENKRMKAAMSTDYLEQILEIKSMKPL